jgi:hypothetical protein
MYGPINLKFPNNTSKWQMGFNSTFKGLILVHLLVLSYGFFVNAIRKNTFDCL